MQHLASVDGVHNVKFDFCTLGMETRDRDGRRAPAKKRTGILTNSDAIATLLREAQRRGEHKHQRLLDGRAGPCQRHPDKLCRLICEGIRGELDTIEWRNRLQKMFDIPTQFGNFMAIQQKLDNLATPPEEDPFVRLYDDTEFHDDNTGLPLSKAMATQARRIEIVFFFKKTGVYTKVRRENYESSHDAVAGY